MKTLIAALLLAAAMPLAAHAGEKADMYKPAMDKMHHAMMEMEPTGDADIDFVRQMIPHHQAAVDMAEIELEKGKDAETRTLAQHILDAQKKEIAQMQGWLDKHDKPVHD